MKKLDPNEKIANRKLKDILQRFDQKIYVQPRPTNGKNIVKIIKNFLKIECPINNAPKVFNKFFKNNELNIQVSKDFFPLKKNKMGSLNVIFKSYELSEVEIYDGLIFSIKSKKNKQSIVGGRFDSLSKSLGLKKINAIGAAFNFNT